MSGGDSNLVREAFLRKSQVWRGFYLTSSGADVRHSQVGREREAFRGSLSAYKCRRGRGIFSGVARLMSTNGAEIGLKEGRSSESYCPPE